MTRERGRVVVAGGSGFIGRSLLPALRGAGYGEVVNLTRAPRLAGDVVAWDGRTVGEWAALLEGAAAVVNLAGRSVNCRYTPANRREILDSRLGSVNALGAALRQCRRPPMVWVQAASLVLYGDAGDRVCDEATPAGEGFSAQVCRLWEQSFAANTALLPETRPVLLRIGFALGPGGGALAPLAGLTRRFLGGTVGSGRQYISWLHTNDLNRLFLRALEEEEAMRGAYNATGPNPVTNATFMAALRRAVGRPWSPPTPEWAVWLGARAMGTEPELALTGRRCLPRRLTEEGFTFAFPDLDTALRDVLGREAG